MTQPGRLYVWPIKAQLNRDVNYLVKMDPYCEISIGFQNQYTKICLNGGREPQ